MENTTFRDFTINIKKSIDRDYTLNAEPEFDDDQKMLNDKLISSIQHGYDSDYEDDIIVDHSEDDDFMITPDSSSNIDTIRLVKVKSIPQLKEELENLNQTRVPIIVDFEYIQERRKSEFKLVGRTLNEFKQETDANVVLLGATGNVVVVTPSEILLMK